MIYVAKPAALLLALAAITSGCVSSYPDTRTRQMAQERSDFLLIQEELRRVKGQLEGIQMENESLRTELMQIRSSGLQAAQQDSAMLRGKAEDLERRIAALEAARSRDREEIIATLTRNMSEAIGKVQPASSRGGSSAPAARSKPKSAYVLEHKVEAGQTLSEIARAYGVTVQVIMDENDLQNPNQIRVGQILYVPE